LFWDITTPKPIQPFKNHAGREKIEIQAPDTTGVYKGILRRHS